MYDTSTLGKTVWEKMVPLGLSWGDDPSEKSMINRDDVFVNTKLGETRITSTLIERKDWEYDSRAYARHLGLGGRFNGWWTTLYLHESLVMGVRPLSWMHCQSIPTQVGLCRVHFQSRDLVNFRQIISISILASFADSRISWK